MKIKFQKILRKYLLTSSKCLKWMYLFTAILLGVSLIGYIYFRIGNILIWLILTLGILQSITEYMIMKQYVKYNDINRR